MVPSNSPSTRQKRLYVMSKDKYKRVPKRIPVSVSEGFSLVSYGIDQDWLTPSDMAFIALLDTQISGVKFTPIKKLTVTIKPKAGTTPEALARLRLAVRKAAGVRLNAVLQRENARRSALHREFMAMHPMIG